VRGREAAKAFKYFIILSQVFLKLGCNTQYGYKFQMSYERSKTSLLFLNGKILINYNN